MPVAVVPHSNNIIPAVSTNTKITADSSNISVYVSLCPLFYWSSSLPLIVSDALHDASHPPPILRFYLHFPFTLHYPTVHVICCCSSSSPCLAPPLSDPFSLPLFHLLFLISSYSRSYLTCHCYNLALRQFKNHRTHLSSSNTHPSSSNFVIRRSCLRVFLKGITIVTGCDQSAQYDSSDWSIQYVCLTCHWNKLSLHYVILLSEVSDNKDMVCQVILMEYRLIDGYFWCSVGDSITVS